MHYYGYVFFFDVHTTTRNTERTNPSLHLSSQAIAVVMHAQIQEKRNTKSQGRFVVFAEDDHVEVKDDPTTVRNWIKHFHQHAQLEDDVLLITVIYFERLISTRKIELNSTTYRAFILVSLLIASKIWDDVSMENGDFAAIADWNILKVNELEVIALEALDWRCTVTAGEYTTYFFKLRSVIGTWGVLGKMSAQNTRVQARQWGRRFRTGWRRRWHGAEEVKAGREASESRGIHHGVRGQPRLGDTGSHDS